MRSLSFPARLCPAETCRACSRLQPCAFLSVRLVSSPIQPVGGNTTAADVSSLGGCWVQYAALIRGVHALHRSPVSSLSSSPHRDPGSVMFRTDLGRV